MSQHRRRTRPENRFRIIGGQWRGRRFSFPPSSDLRPSPDRVRETLFNWLQPVIEGARCLDLFAGSGALGLEALSRGAREVVFVDHERAATAAIAEHLEVLGGPQGVLVEAAVGDFLGRPPDGRFDVVFVDPPYGQGLLAPACEMLARGTWLASGARIYLECEARLGAPSLPDQWKLLRTRHTGRVGYHLAQSA